MKRRPPWKLLCGLAGAVLVAICVFFAWIQAVAARRWEELEKRVPVLIAEARARDSRRPPRSGEGVPGNAWTDYNQALAAVKPLNAADLGDFAVRVPKADRAKAEAALAAYEGNLAFLAAGARKAEGTFPLAFERGFAADLPGLLASQKLANLAVSKARILAEGGKAKAAASLLLDELWFAADIGRNTMLISEMVSAAVLTMGMDELREMVRDPELKGVDWAEVGRALAVLETILPEHGESMMNEAVASAASLSKGEIEGLGFGDTAAGSLSAWRFGFSMKLMVADAVDTHVDAMRRLAEANRTWMDAERVSKEIDAETGRSVNPITRIMTGGLLKAHRVSFERRALLRLLRMAVALRAGQPLPELDDPFGGKLRSDGTKLWSRGQDGVDGGGIGAWRPAPTGDIVLPLRKDELELKKK